MRAHAQLPINERDFDLMFDHLDGIVRFIDGHVDEGLNVHCAAGVSRSPTAVVAYLAWRRRGALGAAPSLGEVKEHVERERRRVAKLRAIHPPDQGLRCVESWLSYRVAGAENPGYRCGRQGCTMCA